VKDHIRTLLSLMLVKIKKIKINTIPFRYYVEGRKGRVQLGHMDAAKHSGCHCKSSLLQFRT
jgi:hypothetical protein